MANRWEGEQCFQLERRILEDAFCDPDSFKCVNGALEGLRMRQMMERPEEFLVVESIEEGSEEVGIHLVRIDNIPEWDLKSRIVHEIVMERLIDPSTFGFYPPPSKQEQSAKLINETRRRLDAEIRRRNQEE